MIFRKDFLFKIVVVLSGIFSGILFIFHHLIIWYRLSQEGKVYNFFSFVNPDPLVNLAPMIRDAIDGHIWISDGRIFENTYLPNLWSFLVPLLVAPLNLIAGSISMTFLLGHFLVAMATFFIVYFLIKRLIGNRVWSLFASILFSSAPFVGYYLFPASVFNLKLIGRTFLHLGSYPGEMLMSKYVSFSVLPGLPFFAAAFYLILLVLEKKELKYTIFAGLLHGMLIYIYITDVMYLFTAMGMMALLFCLNKQFAEVKRIIFVMLIAAITSVFYWWNFLNIRLLPWADEFFPRLGGELTREFRFSQWKEYLLYIGFAAVIWIVGKRWRERKIAIYLIGFVLAAIILLNLQVIIGFNPAPSAWPIHQFYFGFFLAWVVFIYWIYQLVIRRFHLVARIFCVVLSLVVFSAALRIVRTEIYIASYLFPAHTIPVNISRSLEWLEANTPGDSVVASPSLVSNALLPVFTHNNVIVPAAVTSAASQKEIIDRIYTVYSIFGVDPDFIRMALKGSVPKFDDFAFGAENALSTFIFESYYVDHSIDGYILRRTAELPQEVENRLVLDYERYPKELGYLLNRYKLDYVYVGPYEKKFSTTDFDIKTYFEKVYDEGGVAIYKIKR